MDGRTGASSQEPLAAVPAAPTPGQERARPPREHPAPGVRLVIAEHSYATREFLTGRLSSEPDLDLVAVCTNGRELRSAIATWRPDVVLTDIRMPASGAKAGIQFAAEVRSRYPDMAVIVLSQAAEPAYALELISGGAERRAYLVKDRIRNRRDLSEAIHTVAEGGTVIDRAIVEMLVRARLRTAASRLRRLTPGELDLIERLATGETNAALADALSVPCGAVDEPLDLIFQKLGLHVAPDVGTRVREVLRYLAEGGT